MHAENDMSDFQGWWQKNVFIAGILPEGKTQLDMISIFQMVCYEYSECSGKEISHDRDCI